MSCVDTHRHTYTHIYIHTVPLGCNPPWILFYFVIAATTASTKLRRRGNSAILGTPIKMLIPAGKGFSVGEVSPPVLQMLSLAYHQEIAMAKMVLKPTVAPPGFLLL